LGDAATENIPQLLLIQETTWRELNKHIPVLAENHFAEITASGREVSIVYDQEVFENGSPSLMETIIGDAIDDVEFGLERERS